MHRSLQQAFLHGLLSEKDWEACLGFRDLGFGDLGFRV